MSSRETLVLASSNPEKQNKILQIARTYNLDISLPKNFPDIQEEEKSYFDNAILKASTVYNLFHQPTLADDFGMEIIGLNNQPGVKTRRWGEKEMNDMELLEYTLGRIKHLSLSERGCVFTGVGVIIMHSRKLIKAAASDVGILLKEPKGRIIPGHPLASLFFIPSYNKTLSELEAENFLSKDIRIYHSLFQQFISSE